MTSSAKASCALDVADEGEHTMEEVAELLGVSHQRIQQIESELLRKLAKKKIFLQYRKA